MLLGGKAKGTGKAKGKGKAKAFRSALQRSCFVFGRGVFSCFLQSTKRYSVGLRSDVALNNLMLCGSIRSYTLGVSHSMHHTHYTAFPVVRVIGCDCFILQKKPKRKD